MKTMLVKDLLASEVELDAVVAQGWVRTKRESKDVCFVELNDGSCLRNVQVVADGASPCFAALARVNTGASMRVEGKLAASPGKGQKWEL
ncbi:MAG TPA: OB-fold nucleic acid binding domain-containing protein, partial [Candidatus Brocadiia bacterium]|nr:OB-fold nucleic acid binding domain-containing protein [Candidatus Brocadiia bacterium]